jgi:hypothetical protein
VQLKGCNRLFFASTDFAELDEEVALICGVEEDAESQRI